MYRELNKGLFIDHEMHLGQVKLPDEFLRKPDIERLSVLNDWISDLINLRDEVIHQMTSQVSPRKVNKG